VRALRALDALATARRPMTNRELAETLAIGPSSALGLMRELCAGGFVIRDPRTKRYWLDPGVEGVGARLYRASALPPAMARLVQRLADATGESISLAAQFETRITVKRLTPGPEGARPALYEGMIGPLLGSGAGICMLSLMSAPLRAQLIRRCRHYGDSFGPGRRNVADLEAAIRGVQERGYIAQYIEAAGGVAGIAFPVRVGMPVHPFGALIVGGSATRIRLREREIVAVVQRRLPGARRRPAHAGDSRG
jgi:DNA-binding IclR family transcriptional regulator